MVGEGFRSLGSIHSHCSISAGQSGTDHEDEIRQDGIHITIGKIDENPYDIHCRFVFYGVSYKYNISEWIKEADWVRYVPKNIRKDAFEKYLLTLQPAPYPERWDKNVRKKDYNYSLFGKKEDKDCEDTIKSEKMYDIISHILDWYNVGAKELTDIWTSRHHKNVGKNELDELVLGECNELLKEYKITEFEFSKFLDEYDANRFVYSNESPMQDYSDIDPRIKEGYDAYDY